jgi:hypothetical protein
MKNSCKRRRFQLQSVSLIGIRMALIKMADQCSARLNPPDSGIVFTVLQDHAADINVILQIQEVPV